MKVGVRESLRGANTLYRHPNHNILCHLVGASCLLEPLTFITLRSTEGGNVGILFLDFPVLYDIYILG